MSALNGTDGFSTREVIHDGSGRMSHDSRTWMNIRNTDIYSGPITEGYMSHRYPWNSRDFLGLPDGLAVSSLPIGAIAERDPVIPSSMVTVFRP